MTRGRLRGSWRKACGLAVACSTVASIGCAGEGGTSEEEITARQSAVIGVDTFLYFRSNATGWQANATTRLKATATPNVFDLVYTVSQDWMVTSGDNAFFTETNQLDGWGTVQRFFGSTNPLVIVPGGGSFQGSNAFLVRYPHLGNYRITVNTAQNTFLVQEAVCTPTVETCNGLDDDCDGLIDESYLCKPAATAPTIDELITRCPSAAVLDAIDQDFDIRFEFLDQNGDGVLDDPAPMGNALRCTAAAGSRDMTQSKERLYQVLIALRAINFNQPLPFTSLNLYAWMRDSIRGIRLRSDIGGSFCCTPPPGASGSYINIQNDANRSAYVTDLWTSAGTFGLFAQTQLFVHETRHANGPLHTCPDAARDLTIGELGAWAAVYYFSRALAFNSNACFLRPTPGRPVTFPFQLTAPDSYLIDARDFSRGIHRSEFCAEPSVPVEPPEPVFPCGG